MLFSRLCIGCAHTAGPHLPVTEPAACSCWSEWRDRECAATLPKNKNKGRHLHFLFSVLLNPSLREIMQSSAKAAPYLPRARQAQPRGGSESPRAPPCCPHRLENFTALQGQPKALLCQPNAQVACQRDTASNAVVLLTPSRSALGPGTAAGALLALISAGIQHQPASC